MARRRSAQILRAGLVASAFLSFLACGSDAPTSPNSNGKVIGTWVLEWVDDEEPPVAIHRGAYLDPATGIFVNNYIYRVASGYLEIRENETFFLTFQVNGDADGVPLQASVELEGEWDLVDDALMLRVQFPIVGTLVMEREEGLLHTDIDFLGLGETTHLDFKK
jgi:hypothetical protein